MNDDFIREIEKPPNERNRNLRVSDYAKIIDHLADTNKLHQKTVSSLGRQVKEIDDELFQLTKTTKSNLPTGQAIIQAKCTLNPTSSSCKEILNNFKRLYEHQKQVETKVNRYQEAADRLHEFEEKFSHLGFIIKCTSKVSARFDSNK